ncbi:MAG TPA: ribonuclease III [Syntrophorhabdaceae bacterium]|nr:ribonuclease III [Syntrophorhabdaceae bacterium]HOL05996.1 ribonuclease III [Syntrophorhabdaceae bacterium]HON85417.1 ribonuclease III [Syntrophorhabdaceae bacterium]HOT42277.1 ribonuclease III [Syntrophorhabdaceae bacterium]HPC66984.1 ribonuclease III [Syntrophorhabdaceae bacterium]
MFPTPIEEKIGYTFKNKDLLNQAITHSSFFNEKREIRKSDNEKLEYLGDAVLNCIISIILYKKYRDRHEGFLSNARSCLVRRDTLTEIARDISLASHLNYGNGRNTDVPEESKVLSNMMEALIGAIYLDGGLLKTSRVIRRLFGPYFTEERLTEKSPKNILQEYSQKKWGLLPRYKFTRKTKNGFTVNVYIGSDYRAKGQGKTKKEAQQQAAKALLEELGVR